MELKLRMMGNSVGVILPNEVLESLQVKVGDKIKLVTNEKGYQLSAADLAATPITKTAAAPGSAVRISPLRSRNTAAARNAVRLLPPKNGWLLAIPTA